MRRLIMLALATVAACSEVTGPADAARYQLQTVNGAGLPFVASRTDTLTCELLDDAITLNADGTYSDIEQLRATRASGATTRTAASVGVYELLDGEVRFTQLSPALGGFTGSLDGATLTITYPSGNTFVYMR